MDKYTELTGTIIGAAMEVHSYWGPGLIESIYEKSLAHELMLRNVEVKRQVKLQLKYKDLELDDDYTLDLIADGKVIVLVKIASPSTADLRFTFVMLESSHKSTNSLIGSS